LHLLCVFFGESRVFLLGWFLLVSFAWPRLYICGSPGSGKSLAVHHTLGSFLRRKSEWTCEFSMHWLLASTLKTPSDFLSSLLQDLDAATQPPFSPSFSLPSLTPIVSTRKIQPIKKTTKNEIIERLKQYFFLCPSRPTSKLMRYLSCLLVCLFSFCLLLVCFLVFFLFCLFVVLLFSWFLLFFFFGINHLSSFLLLFRIVIVDEVDFLVSTSSKRIKVVFFPLFFFCC